MGATVPGQMPRNYDPVNVLNLYYETHGAGAPLVLLHGGFGATGLFGDLLPELAAHRRVIAVDLQAHGRTADIAALIAHLGLATAGVMGYSLGGGVALQTAIRHAAAVLLGCAEIGCNSPR